MDIAQDTIRTATQYLVDGGDVEAANILRSCVFDKVECVDYWMDGGRQLDGILIEVMCPRASYEILCDSSSSITQQILQAFRAVLPSDKYLKNLCARVAPAKRLSAPPVLSKARVDALINKIGLQKALMISVATGGPLVKQVNGEYEQRRTEIREQLAGADIDDPNPFPDLWTWHGKWSDGSLPSYQSRRRYITEMYASLLDALASSAKTATIQPAEPTGWARVDRNVEKVGRALEAAKNEEDFQAVGLLCRETIISLAQAVYNPETHVTPDGVTPSDTDAKRMIEGYIAGELSGSEHESHRKYARATFDLAVSTQHRRTATFRDAALCAEATRGIVNMIAVISGVRNP